MNAIPPRLMETDAMFSYLNFGYIAPKPCPGPLTEIQSINVVATDVDIRIPLTFIARLVTKTGIR